MSSKAEKATEKAEAIAMLRKMGVKPGAQLFTALKSVSRSGMQRTVSVYLIVKHKSHGKTEADIMEISGLVARAIGYRRDDQRGGVIVGGCGTDVGLLVAYNLGRAMFPKGGKLAHTSGTRQYQAEKAGETSEKDGGYLLRQRWI